MSASNYSLSPTTLTSTTSVSSTTVLQLQLTVCHQLRQLQQQSIIDYVSSNYSLSSTTSAPTTVFHRLVNNILIIMVTISRYQSDMKRLSISKESSYIVQNVATWFHVVLPVSILILGILKPSDLRALYKSRLCNSNKPLLLPTPTYESRSFITAKVYFVIKTCTL